jgi:hypothetical protein
MQTIINNYENQGLLPQTSRPASSFDVNLPGGYSPLLPDVAHVTAASYEAAKLKRDDLVKRVTAEGWEIKTLQQVDIPGAYKQAGAADNRAEEKSGSSFAQAVISQRRAMEQAFADMMVDPETKDKLPKIEAERQAKLMDSAGNRNGVSFIGAGFVTPNSNLLDYYTNRTYDARYRTEFAKESAAGDTQGDKENYIWQRGLAKAEEVRAKSTKTDLEEPLDKTGREFIRRLIEMLKGFSREERSNDIANYNIDAKHRLAMANLSGSPAEQMAAFYGAQNASVSQAAYTRDEAKNAAGATPLDRKRADDLFERETKQIAYETELKIAELKKQEREEDRKFLGEFFDAIDSGKRGAIGKLFRTELTSMEKTMFTNALTTPMMEVGKKMSSFLTPMELGPDGKPNLMGKILQGTPFGINTASPEIKSRQDNTAALDRLTAKLNSTSNAPGSGGGAAGDPITTAAVDLSHYAGAGGSAAGSIFSSIKSLFTGPSAHDKTTADNASYNSYPGIPGSFTINSDGSYGPPNQVAGKNGKVTSGQYLAGAGAMMAGGAALYAGIKQGGASGSAEAVSGGLGAAAGGLMMIPGAQLAGAVVGAASALAGLVSLFTGMSVQEREKQMANNVAGSYDRLPQSQNEQFDISGAGSSITGPGTAHQIGGVTVNLSAFDSKSILDNWHSIANAISHAVQMNHPVVDSIRQAR